MHSLNSRKLLLGLPGAVALFSHAAFALVGPTPANDNFADASLIAGESGTLEYGGPVTNNTGATREAGEPFPAGASTNSVWYKWVAPSTGKWRFVTFAPSFNPVLGVYAGTVVSKLLTIAGSDSLNSPIEELTFNANAGTTYYIDVAANGGTPGALSLYWSQVVETHTIGGRITDAQGNATRNLPVNISGPQSATVATDANGYYTSPALPVGEYTVTPASPSYTYTPASRTINLTESYSALNFTSLIKPNVTVSNVTVNEGNSGTTAAVFTINLSATSTLPVTVNYSTQNDTAVAPSDYTAATGSVVFAPGETIKTVTIDVIGDLLDESDERFNLILDSSENGFISDGLGVATIKNDDDVPVVSVDNPSIAEGDSGTTDLNFTLSLSAPSNKSVSVSARTDLSTAAGAVLPATAGTDYTALPATTFTFAPGETTKTVTIKVNGEVLNEADESLRLLISAPANSRIINGTGIGTITNDDALPVVSVSNVEMTEGNTGTLNATFTVSLSAASGRTVKATVATADVTATSADYTPVAPTVLTFTPGQTSKTVNVAIKGDLITEATETFSLNLSAPENATAGSNGTGTILDNDAQPTLTVVAPSVAEGNTGTVNLPFVLKLSNPSSSTISVNVRTADAAATSATAGTDYVALADTLVTFAPGETSKTANVAVNGDLLNEDNEKLALVLDTPTNVTLGTTRIEGTITNDDAVPTLSIVGASVTEGDSGTKTLEFTVNLSAVSGKTVSATFKTGNAASGALATAGTDYVANTAGTTVSFAPGETSKTVSVVINGDLLNELDERFNGVLSTPVNATLATSSAVGTITNDDAQPVVSIDAASLTPSVIEGNTGNKTVPVTVKLSAASALPVTVAYATSNGTATDGLDYVAQSGTLTFTAGQTSKVVNLAVKGDLVVEGNETFNLNLSAPTNSTLGASTSLVTIIDDDATPSISIDSPSITEGDSGTKVLEFNISLSSPSGKAVTVKFNTAAGTTNPATAGADFVAVPLTTVTFAAGETTRKVSVTINGDTTVEQDETFNGILSAPTNATIGTGTGVATITNDDLGPITISIDSEASVLEGETASVAVRLSRASDVPVSFGYATYDGTAEGGSDYGSGSGSLTFQPGETIKYVSFGTYTDDQVEGTEEGYLSIYNPSNATIGNDTATISIEDGNVAFRRPGGSDNES